MIKYFLRIIQDVQAQGVYPESSVPGTLCCVQAANEERISLFPVRGNRIYFRNKGARNPAKHMPEKEDYLFIRSISFSAAGRNGILLSSRNGPAIKVFLTEVTLL